MKEIDRKRWRKRKKVKARQKENREKYKKRWKMTVKHSNRWEVTQTVKGLSVINT